MARVGRKRKAGRRTETGRASRAGQAPKIDTGTSRAKLKFDQYGTDGADAIGRAYRAGLLGDNADVLRDTARKIARAYWPMLQIGPYRCTLNDAHGTNDNPDDPEGRAKAREEWLGGILDQVNRMDRSRTSRRAFDDLVIDIHPDTGPAWLDSLIWHKERDRPLPFRDAESLRRAIEALQAVSG